MFKVQSSMSQVSCSMFQVPLDPIGGAFIAKRRKNVQSSPRPVTLIIITPLPRNYCPISPISLLTRLTLDHGRVRFQVSRQRGCQFQVSSSFSRFARGALWLNCLLAYERKVQSSMFNVHPCFRSKAEKENK